MIVACLLLSHLCHLVARKMFEMDIDRAHSSDLPFAASVFRSGDDFSLNTAISVLISGFIVVRSLNQHLLKIYPPTFMISQINLVQVCAVLEFLDDQL